MGASSPTVSVVLTTYNRAEPLRGTLDTLLAQTFTDFELLICDDASPDHTESVAREYATRDSRVEYCRNPHNMGMPGNMNEGIRRSRGILIANLHDGDLYDPSLLEKWAAALIRYPRAAFVFNQYRTLSPDGGTRSIFAEPLPAVFPGTRLLEDVFFRRWRFDSPVWGTVMARRSAYIHAGLFDSRFGCVSDVDMWMRLAENHDVAYIQEPLISLPSHESVPSNWKIDKNVVRKIFWEARLRHYSGQWTRRWREVARHAGFAIAWEGYRSACAVRSRFS